MAHAVKNDDVCILTRLEAPTPAQTPRLVDRKANKNMEESRRKNEEYIRIAREAVRSGIIKSWKENKADRANIVHCTFCVLYPDIVGLLCSNRRRAPVTKAAGTQYRSEVIALHLLTDYHLACFKRKNSVAVTTAGIVGSSTPMEACI